MKKLLKVFATLAIVLSVVTTSANTTKAYVPTGDVLSITKDAVCYFYTESKKWVASTATPDKHLGHCMADVERKLAEIAVISQDEADKLREAFDWWTLVDSEDFVNIYHPNTDHTINETDMITIDSSIPENSICIFMYGNKMDGSGNMSAENIGRCETVLALAQKYPGAYIALSGGHTAGDSFDSEAGASYKYLTQQQLPGVEGEIESKFIDPNRPTLDPSRFILDEAAKDTVGNINNSITKILAIPTIKNFITVTSEYHIPRATLLLMAYLTREGLTQQGYTLLDNLGWYSNQSNLATKRTSDAGYQVGNFMQIWTNKTASATSSKRCSIPVQDTFTAELTVDHIDTTKPIIDQVKAICKYTPGQSVTDASVATFEFDVTQDKDHTSAVYVVNEHKVIVSYTYGYYKTPTTVTAEVYDHKWNEPTYVYNSDFTQCTATAVCDNEDNPHTVTETVNVVREVVPATCEVAGVIKYTAEFTKEPFTKQVQQVDGDPKLGHDWEVTEFIWTETPGEYSAQAVCKCKNDSTHTQTVDAEISKVTTDPKCEEAGSTVYTASYNGYTEQKTEQLAATGHKWKFLRIEWADDFSSAKGIFECENDRGHTHEVAATLKDEIVEQPTE